MFTGRYLEGTCAITPRLLFLGHPGTIPASSACYEIEDGTSLARRRKSLIFSIPTLVEPSIVQDKLDWSNRTFHTEEGIKSYTAELFFVKDTMKSSLRTKETDCFEHPSSMFEVHVVCDAATLAAIRATSSFPLSPGSDEPPLGTADCCPAEGEADAAPAASVLGRIFATWSPKVE
jgi:hypothetical protein